MDNRNNDFQVITTTTNQQLLTRVEKNNKDLPNFVSLGRNVSILQVAYNQQDYITCKDILFKLAQLLKIKKEDFKNPEAWTAAMKKIPELMPGLNDSLMLFVKNMDVLQTRPFSVPEPNKNSYDPAPPTPQQAPVKEKKKTKGGIFGLFSSVSSSQSISGEVEAVNQATFASLNKFVPLYEPGPDVKFGVTKKTASQESSIHTLVNEAIQSIPNFRLNEGRFKTAILIENQDYRVDLPSNKDYWVSVNKKSNHGNQVDSVGWKFHIAIDDSDKKNMEKGIDVVSKILMKHGISSFKFYSPDAPPTTDTYQKGKQITIYYEADKDKSLEKWHGIMKEINEGLVNAGIKPAQLNEKDRQLPGSDFISYRNDNDGNGGYKAAEHSNGYNDSNHGDPFVDWSLTQRQGMRL